MRRAAMRVVSPVFGLRPGRCDLSRNWKLPKPDNFTFSLLSSAPRISSKKASTNTWATRLQRWGSGSRTPRLDEAARAYQAALPVLRAAKTDYWIQVAEESL